MISLHLASRVYFYDYLDILLLIHLSNSLMAVSNFNICNYITFFLPLPTPAITHKFLFNIVSLIEPARHFYFNRIAKLWNALPPIDLFQLSLPNLRHMQLKTFLWSHCLDHFDSPIVCSYHLLCPCSKFVIPSHLLLLISLVDSILCISNP